MRTRLVTLLLAAGLSVGPALAADTGTIRGTVDHPERVTTVSARDRLSDEKDKVYRGRLDGKTGRFAIERLPLGATYDIVIDLANAHLEGVNLKVHRSAYAEAGEDEQPLTKEDVAAIKKSCTNLNKFEDQIEVLALEGNCQHAAVLLNKLRTRPFYDSKPGEVIWRLELWHFEKPDETWVKDQDELFITYHRERLPRKDFDKKSLTLDPALGGHKLTAKQPTVDTGTVKLPGTEPGIRIRKR